MKKDIEILRELAKQKAEIASLDVQRQNAVLWTKCNDLSMEKPPIYIDELPWNELKGDAFFNIECEDELAKKLEWQLKTEIYSFKNFPGNMVVKNHIECPICFFDSGFGIDEDVDIKKTNESNSVVSRHFNIQISSIEDIEKLKPPIIEIDSSKTAANLEVYNEIFSEIIQVKKVGVKGYWFTPWDNLIRLTGVEEALMDLMLEPEYIDALVTRFVDLSLTRLERYKELGLWASNNDNTRVGSGGYGYTKDLAPVKDENHNIATQDIWGCGNAQIFSEVSPQMHWDFSLKHELRWLSQFGMNYYGCCEPLHMKLQILDKIPNLRKISTSPWAKIPQMIEHCKGKYALSCKPNPAIFVGTTFDEARAKADIQKIIDEAKGCSFEIVMKDVSTLNHEPQRLKKWAEIAQQTVDENYL